MRESMASLLRRLGFAAFAACMLAVPDGARAAEETPSQSVPRFVSLKSEEVNLRTGPGQRYPIEWVYRRAGYPVEIVAQFDVWRQIRDADGTVGWVHQSLLSGRRSALVTGGVRTLRAEPKSSADGVALAEPGVMLDLVLCQGDWCEVSARGYSGWLRRNEIWGVYPDETLR